VGWVVHAHGLLLAGLILAAIWVDGLAALEDLRGVCRAGLGFRGLRSRLGAIPVRSAGILSNLYKIQGGGGPYWDGCGLWYV
jgi:hypothetical protein